MKAFIVLIFAVLSALPEAKAVDCEFQQRPDDFFFRKLPKEIVGWVKCGADANVVFVARPTSLARENVLSLFSRYETEVVADRVSTRLTHARPNGWMELESLRPNARTSHILFQATASDGSFLLFMYSDAPERARVARSRLGGLRDYFAIKDRAQSIVDATDKSADTVHAVH